MYNLINVNNVNFDTTSVLKKLSGRMDVYIADTTTLANVYIKGQSGDFIATSNPVYTTIQGTFPNCLFVDQDVDTRYYRYIGTSTDMSTDINNEDAWVAIDQQYILKPQFTNQEFDGAISVHTVEDLRAIDTSTFDGLVTILLDGYYEQGDSPVRFYEWLSTSSNTDDAGEYIKPNAVSIGRWKLIDNTSPYVDIRIFGCQPTSSVNSTFECSSQMLAAFSYCNKYSKIVYFANPINGIGVYTFNGNLCLTNFDVYLDDKIYFQAKTGSTSSGITCNNFIKNSSDLFKTSTQTGTFNLICNEVRSSWKDEYTHNYTTLSPRTKVTVDSNSFPLTYHNLLIEFIVSYTKALSLTRCQIISDGKLDNSAYKMIFDSCPFTDRLFSTLSTDEDYLSLSTCYLSTLEGNDSFESVQNYVSCGLLNGQKLFNLVNIVASNLNIKGNALVNNITLKDGYVTRLNLSDMTQTSLSLDAVEVQTLACDGYLFGLNLTNAQIDNHVALDIGAINSQLSRYDIYCIASSVVDFGSTIESDFYCSGTLQCKESKFLGNVTQYPLNNRYDFLLERCRFEAAKHILSYDQTSGVNKPSGCLVDGRWTDNIIEGNTDNFIDLDRSVLEPADSAHNYQYLGNVGDGVIQNLGPKKLSTYIANYTAPAIQPLDAPLLYNGVADAGSFKRTFDLVPWFGTSAIYGPWIDYFAVGISAIEPIECNLKFETVSPALAVNGGTWAYETSAVMMHGSLCNNTAFGVPSATNTFMITEVNFGGGLWYENTFPGSESQGATKYPIVITIDK